MQISCPPILRWGRGRLTAQTTVTVPLRFSWSAGPTAGSLSPCPIIEDIRSDKAKHRVMSHTEYSNQHALHYRSARFCHCYIRIRNQLTRYPQLTLVTIMRPCCCVSSRYPPLLLMLTSSGNNRSGREESRPELGISVSGDPC